MAYTRGRFGVEYQPRGTSETHHLRWLVVVVALLVLAAFVGYRLTKRNSEGGIRKAESKNNSEVGIRNSKSKNNSEVGIRNSESKNNSEIGRRKAESKNNSEGGIRNSETPSGSASYCPRPREQSQTPACGPLNGAAPQNKPRGADNNSELRTPNSESKTNPEARRVEKWLETAQTRPDKERVLLERLAEAERRKNVPVAIDTIKKLYDRPTMADLQDTLVRRLGDLNMQHLLSGATTPWTATVKVRRGDSRDRIARENRTTPAAVSKLNPSLKWEKLQPGDSVRVLNFPNAVLVVYKQRGYADLSLKNGQFFRRYIISISKNAKSAVYPVAAESGSTAHSRLRELGVKATPADRAEIEMFLAPGSRITVAE